MNEDPRLPDKDEWEQNPHSFHATIMRILGYIRDNRMSEALTSVTILRNIADTDEEIDEYRSMRKRVEDKADQLDIIYDKNAMNTRVHMSAEDGFQDMTVIVTVLDEEVAKIDDWLSEAIKIEQNTRIFNNLMFSISNSFENSRLLCEDLEGEIRKKAARMFNKALSSVGEACKKYNLQMLQEDEDDDVDAFGNPVKEGVSYIPVRLPYEMNLAPFDPAVCDDDTDGAKGESDGS